MIKFLFIDDDAELTELAVDGMTARGYSVTTAAGG
jgi:DNA-binding response OmpR family regulator